MSPKTSHRKKSSKKSSSKKKRKQRKYSSSSESTSSSSSSESESGDERKVSARDKSLQQTVSHEDRSRSRSKSKSSKKSKRKRKHSSSSSSSSSPPPKKKKSKKSKRKKKKKSKDKKDSSSVSVALPLSDIPSTSVSSVNDFVPKTKDTDGPKQGPKMRTMTPMTKEEWERQQSVVRRVLDTTTGRERLVKGDGEIIEEIVSKDRHKEINKKATKGDAYTYAQVSYAMSKGLM